MVELRIATEEDLPVLLEMCKKFVDESPYRDYPIEYPKVESLVLSFLSNQKEKICVLAVSKETPIGMIAGYLSPALFSSQQVASEIVWWVDPQYRGKSRAAIELLGAFETWARIVGASYIQMQSLTNEYEMPLEKLFSTKGYRAKEIAYVKRI